MKNQSKLKSHDGICTNKIQDSMKHTDKKLSVKYEV